ncbi:MAG: GAF domain-containing protein [Aestuariibacter sp.]
MQKPDIPKNEALRLQYLQQMEILDSENDPVLDDITLRTKQRFDVPICLVSLVDTNRQWFKSNQGLDATETPRDISFCGHAINYDEILYIPDALDDMRFKSNPLVEGEPDIRFYAGAPLIMEPAIRVGTLCIIDRRPRELNQQDLEDLRSLADEIENELSHYVHHKLSP